MFENIIGQDRAVSLLRRELEGGALPGSLLVHGEPYSGKLTVALEIARVLSCRGDSSWGCRCPSCELQRVLIHPGTLLLGSRAFGAEIAAAAAALERVRTASSRYLYVRAVRKLLRRCDPQLWEGADTRMRPAYAAAAEIEETLVALEPGRTLPDAEELHRVLEKTAERARQVAAALPRDNTPINVIRRAAFWARLSSSGPARAVIIENADRMVDASRNSLLKLLEEPPEGLHVILLTTNPQAIIPTILSRVRRYRLEPRTEASSREVLARVFREESGTYTSLAAYFLAWEKVSGDRTAQLAALYLAAASSPALDERPVMAMYDACLRETAMDGASFFREFARILSEHMRAVWCQTGGDRRKLEAWNAILRQAASEQAQLNLQPALVLQSALYRMREIAA